MRFRSTLLAFGAAALLLGDLAGCDMNSGAPSAPSAPSSSDKGAAAAAPHP